MPPVLYEKVQECLPQLQDQHYMVVIIGYKMCPYSRKALRAVESVPEWKENFTFVGYDFGGTESLKNKLQYNGTFPIVFVRNNRNGMDHVGGGTELEQIASNPRR